MAIRIFAFGGGVQSTAALVLAAQGVIDFRIFAFANVGADSEDPRTLAYVEQFAKPYALAHGIDLREVRKVRRDGRELTLMQHLEQGQRSVGIPVRMANGAPGRRSCTHEFKIAPIAKLAKSLGASRADPAVIGLGISIDEFERMNTTNHIVYTLREYPLITLKLDRANCQGIIERAGLPIPPKSSCFFCPFHTRAAWQRLRQERPALFAEAVGLETMLNARRERLGKDHVFLHSSSIPLLQATSPHRQDSMFEEREDSCESGYCMV